MAQLLAKTNQFNLTTRRHDEVTLRRRVAEGWRVYTMHVTDTFGDFGLTGVAIAVPEGDVVAPRLVSHELPGDREVGRDRFAGADRGRRARGPAPGGSRRNSSTPDATSRHAAFSVTHGFMPRADGRLERSLADGGPAWPPWIERVAGAEPQP